MVITLKQPSSLIHEIRIEKVGNWNLFKFSDSLQLRMEALLDKKKADQPKNGISSSTLEQGADLILDFRF